MKFGFVNTEEELIKNPKMKNSIKPKQNIIRQMETQVKNIGKTFPKQPKAMPRPIIRPRKFNAFEHRSNEEVYGEDDGLTLFDSSKRNQNETGSFFGI
jgi:hypothetical protein